MYIRIFVYTYKGSYCYAYKYTYVGMYLHDICEVNIHMYVSS